MEPEIKKEIVTDFVKSTYLDYYKSINALKAVSLEEENLTESEISQYFEKNLVVINSKDDYEGFLEKLLEGIDKGSLIFVFVEDVLDASTFTTLEQISREGYIDLGTKNDGKGVSIPEHQFIFLIGKSETLSGQHENLLNLVGEVITL